MGSTPITTYGVIGSGWRAPYFLRPARLLPERFRVTGVVTRTAERGAQVEAEWGVPTMRTVDDLIARERPDFVVVSVPWQVGPDVIRAVVAHGVAVVAETPPAPDLDGLRSLWHDVGSSGLVQVAEQYLLMPELAAIRAVVASGAIGQPTSVQVSSTQLYHAVSIIRGLLGVGYEPARVHAQQFPAPLANPSTRQGWTGGLEPQNLLTTIATIDFGGRMGLYDYTDNQWRNPLRRNRLVVRGPAGEIVDGRVTRMIDAGTAVESTVARRQAGTDLNLEGFEVEHLTYEGRVVYRNPFPRARLADDDVAVTALLDGAGAWCRNSGPAPYPLAQACQDHLIGLAIGESVATGETVETGREAWAVG